jgi:hypothetical protein
MISEIKQDTAIRKTPILPLRLFIYKDIVSMFIPIIIAYAIKTTEKWANIETGKKEQEKEMLKWELQHLKYQLQPHFFFNSLNTIYALIEQTPNKAQETVHSLSKLMRYLLYDSDSPKVNISDEIAFMKQYIDLMKLRISDKTKVQVNIHPISEDCKVSPLLFISLIENAFKHGISSLEVSEIFFTLEINKKTLVFTAKNTNFPKDEKDKSGSGIGLINLKKRLELSYPGKYIFETKVEDSIYITSLQIETT